MKVIVRYLLCIFSTAVILVNSILIGFPSSKSVLFFLLQNEIYLRDQASRFEVYRLSKTIEARGLTQYMALQIFQNTEEKNIESLPAEIWRNLPLVKLKVLSARNGGLPRVYNDFNMFLGYTRTGLDQVERDGNIGYLLDSAHAKSIVNLINGKEIGRSYGKLLSSQNILGVHTCTSVEKVNKLNKIKNYQFAIVNVLSGRRYVHSYPSI